MGARHVRVKSFLKLTNNLFSLGELDGKIPEQSIAIRTDKGIVIITGCAHPGIVKTIKHARSIFLEEPIYLVMGGFHLKDDDSEKIVQTSTKKRCAGLINPTHLCCVSARNYLPAGQKPSTGVLAAPSRL